jgi:hypothetical protein
MRNGFCAFTLILGLTVASACGPAQDAEESAGGAEQAAAPESAAGAEALSAEDQASIAQLTTAVQAFQDIEAAKAAGYTDQYPEGCKSTAEGGQGFHYLNPALLDAKVELLTPELVMYEPQEDGSMTLVGVDYAIPFDQWQSADAPTILGRPLMRNEELKVWALHIWTHRPNPSGMFAMWNPSVSCEHAH